jgi:phytanoyl-CoA hydroxylase
MLTPSQRQQYDEQGFVVLPDFLSESLLAAVEARLDAHDEAHNQRLQVEGNQGISRANEIAFTANLVKIDPMLAAFVASDPFVELTTEILGPDIKLYWDQTVYKRPETAKEFPWHQDTGYVPTDPPHYLTCWVPITDATIENGCIWVQPQSHLQGMVEHRPTDIGLQCYFGSDPGLAVPVPRGSVIAFNSMLFHRSGPNLSHQTRKAYVVQFSVEDAVHAVTRQPFYNGPVIARDGKRV